LVSGIERILHQLSDGCKDCPGRVCETGYVPISIEKVCGAYLLKSHQSLLPPPLHILEAENSVFVVFAVPSRCSGLENASEGHCMICSNMAGSFIILYDNYFNVFVKFKD
jgi:hypothetical protein